jgi:hypothetical protein
MSTPDQAPPLEDPEVADKAALRLVVDGIAGALEGEVSVQPVPEGVELTFRQESGQQV